MHPSLPHKNFTVIMMEIAQAWSEYSCWIKEPRRWDKEHAVPSALTLHLITISLWCIFMTMFYLITVVFVFTVKKKKKKKTFHKKTRYTQINSIPGLHLHLLGLGIALDQDLKRELMYSCGAAFASTVKLHLPEHRSWSKPELWHRTPVPAL